MTFASRRRLAQATHCCWVEVDIATGEVHVLRNLSADTAVNDHPQSEGQFRGASCKLGTVFEPCYAANESFSPLLSWHLDPPVLPDSGDDCYHLESPPETRSSSARRKAAGGAPARLTNAIGTRFHVSSPSPTSTSLRLGYSNSVDLT